MKQQRTMIVKLLCMFFFTVVTSHHAKAQIAVAEVVKTAVKKVIKAIDLQVQRLQNNTIRLQNAQKVIENTLSRLKLGEISGWVEKQRKLYADYYDELWKIKAAVQYYRNIKSIIQKQLSLVAEYKSVCALIRQDNRFTPAEMVYMTDVYTGILEESLRNLDQVIMVANAFKTQMTDARRLELIQQADDRIDQNLAHLRHFTSSNALLSMQRARDKQEIAAVKALYGLQLSK